MRIPILVSWSGGKDSALLVQRLRQDDRYEIAGIVTTVTDDYNRISIHGVRRTILYAQTAALATELYEVVIPAQASNSIYEVALAAALSRVRSAHPELGTIAFGDLFLQDVRSYRERLLGRLGWHPVFPLWGQNTAALGRQFVADGFRAILCCVDTTQLSPEWAGREYNAALLSALPSGVDPCGERGEFHTCVHAGPIFEAPIPLQVGERLRRDEQFEYCDLYLRDRGALHEAVV